MASLGGNIGSISPPASLSVTRTLSDLNTIKSIIITSVAVLACLAAVSHSSHNLSGSSSSAKKATSKNDVVKDENKDEVEDNSPSSLKSLLLFCYSCFLKPHTTAGTTGTQQDALESFYGSQAGIYDATRGTLLKGREDMLALVAAQLRYRFELGLGGGGGGGQQDGKKAGGGTGRKPIWVDVGGGTGWNIEAMAKYVDVPQFFKTVYLVDFSPSLCEVARKRFARLGWENVRVVCMDARKFRLEDYEDVDVVDGDGEAGSGSVPSTPSLSSWWEEEKPRLRHAGAELITMSYSLSMMVSFFGPSLLWHRVY